MLLTENGTEIKKKTERPLANLYNNILWFSQFPVSKENSSILLLENILAEQKLKLDKHILSGTILYQLGNF